MQDLHIEYLPVGDITPYEKNARKHQDEDLKAIISSIQEFGFDDPIGIWSDKNIIVEGHGRLMAAKALGMKEVPCIRLDHLTDEQRKAYALAHNKTAELSEWDFDLLGGELDGILEIDMSQFGFDLDLSDPTTSEAEATEDEYDAEPPAEPKSKPGDIYKLGRHRLICGDSTDVLTIDRLMDGKKADLVFTDPPYGMKKEKDGVANDNLNYDDLLDFNRQWIPLTFGALKDNGSWYCWGIDEPLMDIYSNILKPMQKENQITFRNLITWDKGNGQGQLSEEFRMYPIADEKCLFVMTGVQGFNTNADNYYEAWEPLRQYFAQEIAKFGENDQTIAEALGFKDGRTVNHWYSRSQWAFITRDNYEALKGYAKTKGIHDALKRDYDALKRDWYSTRAYFDNTHDNMNNVWHFDRAGKEERTGHATPKPIALCARAIKTSSRPDEIVLDVFGGSGSTLIACEQLNRTCYMAELEPSWVDVIIDRWEKFTGQKAELIAE